MIKKAIISLLWIPFFLSCNQSSYEYLITSFGAKDDGKTVNTRFIQQAIDACHDQGGGKVVIPHGEFISGTIVLKSRVNLYLEQGARLIGSPDTSDYMIGDYKHGLIYAYQASQITISGEGEIHGNGTGFHLANKAHMGRDFDRKVTRQGEDYMPEHLFPPEGPISFHSRPGMMLVLHQCEQVDIKNVTFSDSPHWTFRIADCDDVLVSGISIYNNLMIPNSDGIHCTTSRNVRISDCDIRAGDDAIIVTGFGTQAGVDGDIYTKQDYSTRDWGNKTGYAENITVSNCVLKSRSAGIRVGYGINSIRNCVFSNLVIYESNRGIGIFSRDDGSIENILFSDITIQNRMHSGHWWGNGEAIHVSAVRQNPDRPAGPVKNIRFKNIIIESESGMVIYGSPESPISDLVLENVSLKISAGIHSESYGGNFDLRPVYTSDLGIFEHDIPALYSQHTIGLKVLGLEVKWEGALPAFMTQAIYSRDFTNLTIKDFLGSPAHSDYAAIELLNGKGLLLEGNRSSHKNLTLLHQSNVYP